jgi:hypothetical protein
LQLPARAAPDVGGDRPAEALTDHMDSGRKYAQHNVFDHFGNGMVAM